MPAASPLPRTVRRRRVLAVLALVAVLVAAVLLVRETTATDTHGARLDEVRLDSRATGAARSLHVAIPAGGGRGRGLLVLLPGRDQPSGDVLSGALFAALRGLGAQAPVIAVPEDDGSSYWHDRRDGAWSRYVTDEAIPAALRRSGADPRRVAIGGISMGGFGALELARSNPGRFCAAGGRSPALWERAGDSAAGAFDDAEDFGRHDVIAATRADPGAFGATPLWLDAGDEDPFDPGLRALRAALRGGPTPVTYRRWPGGHDTAYWDAHWRESLAFYARALSRCRGGT